MQTTEYITKIVAKVKDMFGNYDREDMVEMIKTDICESDDFLFRQLEEYIEAILDGFQV